ncbi:MAG: MFS transporter [Anaerolineae bacterium]
MNETERTTCDEQIDPGRLAAAADEAPPLDEGPTTVEKLRALPWGVAWSVANSVFAQYTFFGSIFILFLNELGLDKGQIGSLLSLLPFLGIVAVFVASTLARLGYKRVFLASMASRTATAALLLAMPAILAAWGQQALLAVIVVVVGVFGLFRATGFTAFYPWLQEQVPDSVRGKYTAVKNALASLCALLATLAAGYVLGTDPDLGRFRILFVAGVLAGVISIWAALRIPGGAPVRGASGDQSSFGEMLAAGRDRNFLRYLAGIGLVTLATGPLVSFVPLFMKDQVGLSSRYVVWLDTGVLLGGLVSSYLWGWLADRYGSKPVMISGVLLLPLMPLAWLLTPWDAAGPSLSLLLALAIALGQGLINTGWSIGSGRLLFVGVVPPERNTSYMALYYAWAGVAGALGQLLGGWLVDASAGLQGQWGIVRLSPYAPLFLVGILFPLAAHLLFRRVQADSPVSAREFAGMFLRGNPFLALESLVRYHRARDERAAVAMTERLGATRSPLTVEELTEALHDPRFAVRFEAIVSIARRGPDPRLTEALIETLEGSEPALSTVAAWALGRIGDEGALEALRGGLEARYRSVQAHCARSLGNLGDRTVLPILLARLEGEEDPGLQLAYAAALGQMGAGEAAAPLLDLLRGARRDDARRELALALARLTGDEHDFIQLQRRAASEPGTALSQAVTALKGRLARSPYDSAGMAEDLDAAADALAHDDLAGGAGLLAAALGRLPAGASAAPCGRVLIESIACLDEYGPQRPEYILLALHAATCMSGG